MSRMGWGEWNFSLVPPGKLHSEGRLLMRKATSRDAIDSYRPLIEANNRLFLKNALGMVGDPSPLVNQSLFLFASAIPCLTRTHSEIGTLIVRITYADALSEQEMNDLIKKNEESVRLTTETLSRVYLVNFIPMRMLISMLIKPLNQTEYTSQVYPCLGTRRWVPASSCSCQRPEHHNS
jgi:hypothetical protein